MTSTEAATLAATLNARAESGRRGLEHPTNPGGAWGMAVWAHDASGLVYAVQVEGALADWYVMSPTAETLAAGPLYAGTALRMIMDAHEMPTCVTVAEALLHLAEQTVVQS